MIGDQRTRSVIKVPELSEKLREWALPMMALAAEADERRRAEAKRESDRASMHDSLMELAKSMGAEVKVSKNVE